MEVAVIDWNSIDSRFVKDDLYEHINAPKWVDFAAPAVPVDDEAWFCRPGCNHPKTVEDFLDEKQGTPSISKDKKAASVSDVSPFGDRNKREATLKKRGGLPNNQPFGLSSKGANYHRIAEYGENQDPNLLITPQNHKARAGKEAIKSSAEKKEFRDDTAMGMGKEQTPKLRSTLSARNLFSGGDFLSKVAEFCNELKKLAVRSKDKENAENLEARGDESLILGEKEKERKPLLAMSNEKSESEVMNIPTSNTKLRKKIRNNNNMENTPISIDMNKIKPQEAEEGVLQIRTCPPTPQCFSAGGHGATPKDTPPKRHRPKPPLERGILQELKQTKKEAITANNRIVEKDNEAVKEAKAMDVFWFLKPCTTLSS